eukprot:2298182-Pyramimonas_sp.AAC.1
MEQSPWSNMCGVTYVTQCTYVVQSVLWTLRGAKYAVRNVCSAQSVWCNRRGAIGVNICGAIDVVQYALCNLGGDGAATATM